MAKQFSFLAAPAIISQISDVLVLSCNAIFAGNSEYDSASKLAGFGLGNLIMSMFGRYIILGMNCAIETLVSQANG